MGSFEKLVVLTVIFLASIIVAVSFQSDDESKGGPATEIGRGGEPLVSDGDSDGVSGGGGLDAATPGSHNTTQPPSVGAGSPNAAGTSASRPNPFATGTTNSNEGAGLLSATGATQAGSGSGAPGGSSTGANPSATGSDIDVPTSLPAVLSTATGLTPAYAGNGMYYYTVVAQDRTWAGLSEKFYGSSAWAGLLQRENAAVDQPQPGSQIIVPSRTEGTDLARTQPYVARAPGRPAPPSPKVVPGLEQVPAAELTGQTYRTHVVGAGETLGGIAFHYYQRASLWKRIYDANRDVLVDPDRLVQGTTLKIP